MPPGLRPFIVISNQAVKHTTEVSGGGGNTEQSKSYHPQLGVVEPAQDEQANRGDNLWQE